MTLFSRLAAASILVALLACDVLGAPVASSLRAQAQQGPVEVFVLLGSPSYAEPEPLARAQAAHRRGALRAALASTGTIVRRELRTLPALVLEVDEAGLEALAAHPDVRAVDALQYGGAALAESVQKIGAGHLHERALRGEGSVIALLDTGIDAKHPDVLDRIDREECICARCCPGGENRASGPGSAASVALHGPHVGGILASGGAVAAEGVAPAAHLIAVRVLNDANRGSVVDWLVALDLILDEHPEVVAVNMSLVSDTLYEPPCDEANAFTMAFSELASRLRRRGTLVAAAAGNQQEERGTLPMPACVRDVIAVGAVTKTDEIASFSNTAPELDLLAPGVEILSDAPNEGVATLSGTSMATPHVTATIALLLPLVGRPFTAALAGVLRHNAVPLTDPRTCVDSDCQTFPRLDAEAAADWLGSIGDMCSGGGATAIDCQVEWKVAGMPRGKRQGRAGRYRCRDGESVCDADVVSGQCTFRVQACFNVPDKRLTTCDPLQVVDAFRLSKPSLAHPRDEIDLQNAVNVLGSLPELPIDDAADCGSEFSFVVPAGAARTLRLTAESLRGNDVDRLRFACYPAPIG